MKVLVIDINKCNGCYHCQIACKDEHVGDLPPPENESSFMLDWKLKGGEKS
jgi:Fe-S-cluster-containing dehydrogenase component